MGGGRKRKNKYKSEAQWRKREEELNPQMLPRRHQPTKQGWHKKRESEISIAIICEKVESLESRWYLVLLKQQVAPFALFPLFLNCFSMKANSWHKLGSSDEPNGKEAFSSLCTKVVQRYKIITTSIHCLVSNSLPNYLEYNKVFGIEWI